MVRQYGFTLIELMIAVAIIGVLAAIAYPSYTEYRVRTNRADLQKEMLAIAQAMQNYKGVNSSYANATIAQLYGATTYPSSGTALYNFTFNPAPTATEWTLVATPRAGTVQAGNGVVCLNQEGQKFWSKGATSCALSNASDWDGR